MSIAEAYASLAHILDYPVEKEGLRASLAAVAACDGAPDLEKACSSFDGYVAAATLSVLQEEYVATFDFNPATAPYLGHHLFGDNQKKAGYMIMLKQEFGRHGFTPLGNELPDHVSVVLGFLAHLAEKGAELRQRLIMESVLPGMERLAGAFTDRTDCPWKSIVEAARLLCAADCKEVHSC